MAIEKSPLADAIAAHWNAMKRQRVEVPEWNTTIYYDPLSVAECDKLAPLSANEQAVEALILKATDEAGNPIFTKADKMQLLNMASPTVVKRIATAILIADMIDVNKLGEHSPTDQEAAPGSNTP